MVTSGLIITIAARIDLAKDASRILIRLSQIFPINMAFTAYVMSVMENVILFFSPGGAFARILKPPAGFLHKQPSTTVGLLQLFQRKMTNTR